MLQADIDEIFRGSIDMHIHHGPNPGTAAFDPFEIAEQACHAGMGGVVFKDTGYLNAPIVTLINKRQRGDFKAFGSICLNNNCGGLNLHAVESAARLGAKVVWMPTSSSENSMKKFRSLGVPVHGEGIRLLDENERPAEVLLGILECIKRHDMILATGHIAPEEVFAVVEEAVKLGINKIIITHPLGSELVMDRVLTLDETISLTAMGAYAEHTFVFHLPTEMSLDPKITAANIRAIGPEKCIISSDLGIFQHNVGPVEGFRMFVATLCMQGISGHQISLMAKHNPRKLLGMVG